MPVWAAFLLTRSDPALVNKQTKFQVLFPHHKETDSVNSCARTLGGSINVCISVDFPRASLTQDCGTVSNWG